MRKFYFRSVLTLFLISLLPVGLLAQNDTQRSASDSQHEPSTHITASHALDVGYAFMHTGGGSKSGGTQSGNVSKQAMQLVYIGRATDTLTHATTDCYYVFALQPKGFVIVAADNRVEPILGYSYDNNFVVENMPEHIKGWLNDYEKQIEVVTKSARPAEADIQTKWTRLESGQPISNTRNGITVGPLLTTTWDQAPYYNTLCPEDPNGLGGHVVTGCVATAMAQIINYWGYPLHGRGSHSYNSNYGTLTVNYDSVYYDYANMPDILTSTSTPDQVNAVAQLMYHCGVATDMEYYPSGSYAFEGVARAGLINFFRFSPDLSIAEKYFFTETEWNNLLQENIAASHPVLYSGSGDYGGHGFVCDGYDADGYYHFNFGWSGSNDGWYLTNAINPNYEYNSSQRAIVGIVPDSTGNVILGQVMGTSTFIVDEPLEFYHLLGHNSYTGEEHGNNLSSSTVFVSADTTKQLVLDILSYENQYINVYDSINGNQLATLSPYAINNLSSIISTSSMLTILYQGSLKYNGFQLCISQDNGCPMVSNITTSVDSTTIHLTWTENGSAIQWQVEYGLKGFSQGEGSVITSNVPTIDITGLTSFKEYDIYIRPVCGSNLFGLWRKVTERAEAKYWTDVVTNQPDGYVEDEDGNVTISSAEGLAWLSKLAHAEMLEGRWVSRYVTITEDINLGRYKWKPISRFSGVFDGQAHRIDSMYVNERGIDMAALFQEIHSANLNNIYLTNCYSEGNSSTAGLLCVSSGSETKKDTVMNCFVSGTIKGNRGEKASIIANANYVVIINCASVCNIISGSEYTIGGVVAGGYYSLIKNCYSANKYLGLASWQGLIVGHCEYTLLENCYGHTTLGEMYFSGGGSENTYRDNTWFDETDSGFYLIEPIFFESDSQYFSNLKDVLNAGVRKFNLEGLRLWVDDTSGINEGMPILGQEYTVTCPNIRDVAAKNVQDTNGINGVKISWMEMGDATTWEIKYHIQDSTSEVRVLTTNNPDTIWGLTEQSTYLFSVRPICSSTNRGGWSDEFSHVFDRPYWTEIVTVQPDGYLVDEAGNVTISSAEGLAWLISTVNGLNGQTSNSFENKNVTLTQDVNIGQYKWTAINEFQGVFDGGGYVIRGLYLNELTDYQGMFSRVYGGKYMDVYLDNVNINGRYLVGVLCGHADNSIITNCHISGSVQGENNVGGIAGGLYLCELNACSSHGVVNAKHDEAGGLSAICSGSSVRNCYSTCNVTAGNLGAGGLFGNGSGKIENCYAVGNVYGYLYNGGIIGNFQGGALKNCYASGNISRTPSMIVNDVPVGYLYGAVVGSTSRSPVISNCYGMKDAVQHSLIGASVDNDMMDNDYPFISDTASFVMTDRGIVLLNDVPVDTNYYNELIEALNAWVDIYDTAGVFLHWVEDTAGVNGGFPVLGEIRYNTITLSVADSVPYGNVSGAGIYSNIDSTIISAIPDYGYHFVQWNDGNTDNPRVIKLTQDTAFTAVFGKNLYDVIGTADLRLNYSFNFDNTAQDNLWTLQNGNYENRWYINSLNDTNRALFISHYGQENYYLLSSSSSVYAYTSFYLIPGDYNFIYNYYESVGTPRTRVALVPAFIDFNDNEWTNYSSFPNNAIELSNINNFFYDLSEWIIVNGTFSISEGGEYMIVIHWYYQGNITDQGSTNASIIDNIQIHNNIPEEENNHGYVLGSDTVQYLDSVVLTAVPYEGYQFVQWHDGNTDNPRTVVADADKVLRAMFERAFVISDSIVACDSYQWHGNVYTASTMLFDTLPAAGGGDSIVAHYLMVNHPAHTAITETACESYVWTHADGTTQTCTVSDDYTYSHIDANGCTQVDTLHLTINHGTHNVTAVTECESYTWTEGTGTTYTESGVYTYTYTNNSGCPSVDTLYLTINHGSNNVITVTECGSYTWNNVTYTESGTYTQSFINAAGCDSVVTLHLTLYHEVDTVIYDYFCNGSTYPFFGQQLSLAGTYTYTGQTVHGCDSTVTLHLEMQQIYFAYLNEHLCDGEGYDFFGETLHTAGTYTQVVPTVYGCDSTIVLNLTTGVTTYGQTTASICEGNSCNFHGQLLTIEGDYTKTLTNASGCDSIVTLHLTVSHATVGDTTAVACESFTWGGNTYTESGDYTSYQTNVSGCDSVVTLHLTINESVNYEFAVTCSDSCYIWNGQTYCASGDYTQTFETVDGCDSVVTLHLTITVGIGNHDLANTMMLYPNPTSDVVNVQLTMNNERMDRVDIQVFDVYGRLLEVVTMGAARGASLQTIQINLSRYANGVYFVKAVSDEKVVAVRKVVKD